MHGATIKILHNVFFELLLKLWHMCVMSTQTASVLYHYVSAHLYLTKALSPFLGIVDSPTFRLLTKGENFFYRNKHLMFAYIS